jgi:methionyl aminopeptidase
MSFVKSEKEIKLLKEGGKHLAFVLEKIKEYVAPGITTKDLDRVAEEEIKKLGDTPSFLNYTPWGSKKPYPASLCVSVNEEVVHGIPGKRILKEGDIVGLDIGLIHEKLFVDMAETHPVGKINVEDKKLIEATKKALYLGIESVAVGKNIGAIGNAIERFAKPLGYGIVRDLGGHGVGHKVHEEPYIPNFGKEDSGERIVLGMVLAIEPMLNRGTHKVKLLSDGYTVVTQDGSQSAHFEHTIAVTEKGPIILTQ